MTPQIKQSELERCRAIVLAALDYLEERFGGSFVYDQYDPAREYYQQEKVQTEKYFRQRRLDRIQRRLDRLVRELQQMVDVNFSAYIKKRTGYDIDIFEDLQQRVQVIKTQNDIRSEREVNDLVTMLKVYDQTSTGVEEVEKLRVLLTKYSKQKNNNFQQREEKYSEVISKVEDSEVVSVTVTIMTGPKLQNYAEQEMASPDGKRKLVVVQNGKGNHASTYVAVHFSTVSGNVYVTRGIYPDLKAWWKDNSTIVIETSKAHSPFLQYRQVRSFNDIISIEYI